MSQFPFIDIAYRQQNKHDQLVAGEACLIRQVPDENRLLMVLSKGAGYGVKANMLANMTATMALRFLQANVSAIHAAEIMLETMPLNQNKNNGFTTFTMIDIEQNGNITSIQFGNPAPLYFTKNMTESLSETHVIDTKTGDKKQLQINTFRTKPNDRLIIYTHDLFSVGQKTNSTTRMNEQTIHELLSGKINENQHVTSKELAHQIIRKAVALEKNKPEYDFTVVCIHIRNPKKLLICSGPPFLRENDVQLANTFVTFKGTKYVCGGTTSQIISKITKKQVEIDTSTANYGVPPSSKMDGADLIFEGVLTLDRVLDNLSTSQPAISELKNPVHMLTRGLLEHDHIEFLTGTQINPAHQDPAFNQELDIRKNIIKKIALVLKEKYLKNTVLNYI